MALAIEILFAPATELYRNDPSSFNSALKIVESAKGSLGIYHGAVLEDPNTLFLLVVWETLEAHHALINDKEVYAKLAAEVSKCADVTKLELFHIHANAELASVINAPFTSFAHITALKPGVSASEVEVQLDALTKLKNETGKHGGVWGKVVEKDGQLALYGWDDPKDHEAFATSNSVTETITKLSATIEKTKRGHVKFITYKKY